MRKCKACGLQFYTTDPTKELCHCCEEALKRLNGYAMPVVHGRWEDIYHGKYANPRFRCSACKAKALYVNVLNGLGNWIDEQELSNYCHNCGAKMDGDWNG